MVPMLLKTKQDPSPAKRQQVFGVFFVNLVRETISVQVSV